MLRGLLKVTLGLGALCLIGAGALTNAELQEQLMYRFHGNSVVKLTDFSGSIGGTGFQVIAPSGKQYTLTNSHICEIGQELIAQSRDGYQHLVNVVEKSKEHDLCIMSPVRDLRALKISKKISLLEKVYLVGHPGLRNLTVESGRFLGNVEIGVGYTCRKGEEPKEEDSDSLEDLFIRLMFNICVKKYESSYIDAISYGGNSGSPVLNRFGRVVGVLFANSPSQPTSTYMVPLAYVIKFMEDK